MSDTTLTSSESPSSASDQMEALRTGESSSDKDVKRLCRRCRYERCLEIGMKEEALHPKRDAIGSRRSNLNAHSKTSSTRRFCFRYTIIEHGLYTSQMPSHENVWFLSDRTCLIRDFIDIPEEIKRHLTTKIIEEQRLLLPLTTMLIDEVAQPLRRLKLRPIEVAALKILMLLKPTLLFESYKSIATSEDLHILYEVRNLVLRGLHAFYESIEEDEMERRIGDVLMLLGGIEVCAAQTLEEMHLLHVFNICNFDSETIDAVFGVPSKDDFPMTVDERDERLSSNSSLSIK
ncbi:hypothetical protein WR25_23861 [Diploscapter pachys]|uniref:NR LBD domain-containing protein n=1 Tax=Diploscapter pachys TaxID=2018661 RepID=A0A2A2L9E8_9BILA|nr:hypothetical protein WR25_23861 [Diploscapter pachys]